MLETTTRVRNDEWTNEDVAGIRADIDDLEAEGRLNTRSASGLRAARQMVPCVDCTAKLSIARVDAE